MPADPISVEFGGIRVSFAAEGQAIPVRLQRHAGFFSPEPAEFCFSVHLKQYPDDFPTQADYSASNWVAHRLEGGIAIEFGKLGMPPGKFAYTILLDAKQDNGDIYLNQRALEGDMSPLDFPLMLAEVIAAQLLAYRGGILLHACGVQSGPDKGLVFSGVSGAGKTTTARLWSRRPTARLMSDERLAVRKIDGRFVLYSTPWNSPEFDITRLSAPLAGIFFLRHGAQNQARPMEINQAVTHLLQRAYLPAWDRQALENSLGVLEELAGSAPCYDFAFTPDTRAVEYVEWLNGC